MDSQSRGGRGNSLTIYPRQLVLFGAIALITAAHAHASEERIAAPAVSLERVFVGVPTQLTLPPDLAAEHAGSAASDSRCDAVAEAKSLKGQRVTTEREGGDESCPPNPVANGEPAAGVTDRPKTSGHRGH